MVQTRSPYRLLAIVLLVAAVLAGVRAAFLLVRMELHIAGVQRFHVEAATLLFVAVSFISRALSPSARAVGHRRSIGASKAVVAVIAIGVALLAFAPALHIGLLSDDWVLVPRVASGHFGPVSTGLFRPVPLLVWAVLLKIGGGAPALHALNILIHGVNAFLVCCIASDWVGDEVGGAAAGLLFLLTPLAVEPVTWCSGVFDVSSLFFCLSAVLLARRAQHSVRAFLLTCGCAVLAVLSKESAVVLPGLLIVDAAIRRTATRRFAALILTVGLLSVSYAGLRLFLAFGAARPPTSKYVLQRALFNTFGALAVPLPSALSPPWLAVAGVLVMLLAAGLLLVNRNVGTTRLLLLAGWCVACIVPVYPILFVSSDLEGSRYLYESMAGWAALLGLAAFSGPSVVRACGMSALSVLLAMDIVGSHRQLHAWQLAGTMRDRVETAARTNISMQKCAAVAVTDLPDSVLGAYVLRNGGTELLQRAGVTMGAADRGCRFRWSSVDQRFVPSE